MKRRWTKEAQSKSTAKVEELLWLFSDDTISAMLVDLLKTHPSPRWQKDHAKMLGIVSKEAHKRGPTVYSKLDYPDDEWNTEELEKEDLRRGYSEKDVPNSSTS